MSFEKRPYDGYSAEAFGGPRKASGAYRDKARADAKTPHQAVSKAAAEFHKRYGRAPDKVTEACGYWRGLPWKI